MLIQCTKKLLEVLQVEAEPLPEEKKEVFSWHANLAKVNRRKAVVLVNDSNKYVVVLFGLKAGHLNELNEHIQRAVRDAFQEECIKEEIIHEFMEQSLNSSKGVRYTKTKGRSMVTRLNKACESVHYFEDLLDYNSISQPFISKMASRRLIGMGSNGYVRPNEELYRDLENIYGEPVLRTKALQIKVALDLEKHHVWRRLVVPVNMTFYQLHRALQVAFNWKDYHLHEFIIYGEETADPSSNVLCLNHPAYNPKGLKPIVNLACDEQIIEDDSDMPVIRERGIRLSEYIPTFMKYIYDFGDYWEHYIEVEKIIDDFDRNYPVCLGGEGIAPPEDVGGSHGFEEFLEIIADEEHPEHHEMINWGKWQGYMDFDMKMVNKILQNT